MASEARHFLSEEGDFPGQRVTSCLSSLFSNTRMLSASGELGYREEQGTVSSHFFNEGPFSQSDSKTKTIFLNKLEHIQQRHVFTRP